MNAIEAVFHDLKVENIEESLIIEWLNAIDPQKLINRRSLTWRNLSDNEKNITETSDYVRLIQTYPTVLKRPLLFNGIDWSVGFNEKLWNSLFLLDKKENL
jgi:arsenate reductase-like glutaredoxin family protein